jgi:hypothetical protein
MLIGYLSGCAFAAESQHVPGRIIVKLRPNAAEQVARALGGQGSLTPEQVPVEPLRRISQEVQVQSWKPLFSNPLKEDPSGLNRIFLLTCDPSVDVLEASRAFSALSEFVEYAEPDRIVEAQPAP